MHMMVQTLCAKMGQQYADGNDAQLRLQLYEALMALMEREGAADAAALFARVALQQVPMALKLADTTSRQLKEGRSQCCLRHEMTGLRRGF